ncbi:MAG TPA: xanthine dehydrogenase family protein molybdopterin-binding subunit [Tepidisphaeraceae bacterium]|nr:xanthine dehydrogenase family protein molybdopterin-binding subunit [Tepidisphaeraceae bacterium]
MATKTIKVPKMVNGAPTAEVEEIQVEDYGNQSWGPKDKHRLINTKIPRVDAPYKTTGTAQYTHDVRVPGMLHGRLVTSPYAHAKVTSIDTDKAMKIDGVKKILAIIEPGGEIYHEGQPVVAVAATTPEIAEDVARAVVVKYEVLPHVITAEDAMKPGVQPLIPARGRGGGRGGNSQGTAEQVDAALKNCDAVVEVEYRTPILHHCCLETHSCVSDFRGEQSATVYVSTQGTFTIPAEAARELGVPVTGVVQHMGGGFGSKLAGIGIAGQWATRLSKQTNTPVKLVLTRREEFLTSGNGPGSVQKFKAGASKDGVLVALNATQYSMPGIGNGNIAAQPYQYKAQNVYRQAITLATHEDGAVPMRAPGHPQACFAMESLMDELAYKIGMDPVEFRKKNVTDVAWHRQLDTGAKAIGWDKRNLTPGAAKGPLVRGMGCAIGAWGGGGGAGSQVDITIGQDGSVSVAVGSQDIGTGTRTYVRAIVAEELGLEMTDVQEKIGNSMYGNSSGSGGSRTTASLAPALKDAAYNARVALSKIVAPLIGADPDAVWFDNRYIMGNGKAISWKQSCAALPTAGLAARGAFQAPLAGQGAHGASFAEVEVDIETGHVRVTKMCHVQDGGLIMNRLAVESQINGGMIQSIGMALYEGRVMDAELGVMINPAFNDYKLPGAMEIPELIPIIDDGDTRDVVIGIAEPGNIPGCGAIANAVYNACGVRVRETPITPDKILNGLMQMRRVNA